MNTNTHEDMKTNQYWVKIQFASHLVEVVEIWADSESTALYKAQKIAIGKIELQCETPEETELRELRNKFRTLDRELDDIYDYFRGWPEYMDDTEEDKACRREHKARAEELAPLVAALRDELDNRNGW